MHGTIFALEVQLGEVLTTTVNFALANTICRANFQSCQGKCVLHQLLVITANRCNTGPEALRPWYTWSKKKNYCDAITNKIRPKWSLFGVSGSVRSCRFIRNMILWLGKRLRFISSVQSEHTGELLYSRNYSCNSNWKKHWHFFVMLTTVKLLALKQSIV